MISDLRFLPSEFGKLMAGRTQSSCSASPSRQTASQSLSFGIQRILQDQSSETDSHQQTTLLSHRLHQPTAASNLLATSLPWRPYFGVVTIATDSVSSAWLPSHPSELALSLATTGAPSAYVCQSSSLRPSTYFTRANVKFRDGFLKRGTFH